MKFCTRRYMILRRALDVIEWRKQRGTAGGLEYLDIRLWSEIDAMEAA